MPDELWTEVRDIVQETGIKTIPMEKKMQKSKMAVWGGLTNSCEKKRRSLRKIIKGNNSKESKWVESGQSMKALIEVRNEILMI